RGGCAARHRRLRRVACARAAAALAPGQLGRSRRGLPLRQRRVRVCGSCSLGRDACPAPERQLGAWIDDLLLPGAGAGHEDDARRVSVADEDVLAVGRAVEEVARRQAALLALDEQQAGAGEDEEVLLVRLPVIQPVRLARLQDAEREAGLRERDGAAFEEAARAEVLVRDPSRVEDVDDEPALAGRREARALLAQARLLNHGRAPRRALRWFVRPPST